jgi:hypothetical protein
MVESFRRSDGGEGCSELASKLEAFLGSAVGEVNDFGRRQELSKLGHPVLGVELGWQLEERQPASTVLDPELLRTVRWEEWMQGWLPNRCVPAIAHHHAGIEHRLAVIHGEFLGLQNVASFFEYPLKAWQLTPIVMHRDVPRGDHIEQIGSLFGQKHVGIDVESPFVGLCEWVNPELLEPPPVLCGFGDRYKIGSVLNGDFEGSVLINDLFD